ncbi:N-acetyltransferase [Shewanella psychropiezotolerans]|uniref:N-acetyltransferase n=1 Tax=Shewanella psychropiezotolerans TaxID=2593655 RepID=A0ABX5WZS0_9GAMM|nr:GNAT family N-acetyltransferase [Shewanella psychropiezotolerans]QDO84612.1 N-acetyltransferase [Shewanella psychropiezotolerans]
MFGSDLKLEFSESISTIPADEWNALMQGDVEESGKGVNPFTCHAYLLALEDSRCVCPKSGWTPMHLSVLSQGKRIALMPLYSKSHSYGEYVFDWAWAEAYERNHIDYYPKLLSAVPFTPVTGNRLGIGKQLSEQESQSVVSLMIQALSHEMRRGSYSSWHCLFMPEAQHKLISLSQSQPMSQLEPELESGLSSPSASPLTPLKRRGTQFHWRNQGYRVFDDFLSAMSSRKRKNIIKERNKAQGQGYTFRFIPGIEVTEAQWQSFYYCYQITYAKRSGHYGYLNLDFFKLIGATMPEQVQLLVVEKPLPQFYGSDSSDTPEGLDEHIGSPEELGDACIVAAALYFTSDTHLYGRYWGCLEEADALHFEACYYQGIEYCIKHGLQALDAGAQGEHKISRGFEPMETYSNHEIAHPGFRDAIESFTLQEAEQNRCYMIEAAKSLPFKNKE